MAKRNARRLIRSGSEQPIPIHFRGVWFAGVVLSLVAALYQLGCKPMPALQCSFDRSTIFMCSFRRNKVQAVGPRGARLLAQTIGRPGPRFKHKRRNAIGFQQRSRVEPRQAGTNDNDPISRTRVSVVKC